MRKANDAYGAGLWDYFKTKEDKREIVKRDNNFIDGARSGDSGRVYFSENLSIRLTKLTTCFSNGSLEGRGVLCRVPLQAVVRHVVMTKGERTRRRATVSILGSSLFTDEIALQLRWK